MIRHCRYVIAVQDLRRSAEYYRNILGFEVLQITDPGWRVFQRDDCVIMAGECRDALSPATLGDHSYFALGAKARVPYELGRGLRAQMPIEHSDVGHLARRVIEYG
ncbi:MAG: VOC family protein [Candidatus Cybelea sp.]